MSNELFELNCEWDRNYDIMVAKDEKAKREGKLVGRFVREAYADGYAYYEIVSENKNTLRIKSIKGLGDDWTIPYWGDEANVEKDYVVSKIELEDRLAKLIK